MRRAAAVYGLFVGLVFAPFFLRGEVFVPGDFLSFIYPWRAYESGFPHNIELFDVAVFFYPQDVFYNASLKNGEFPLWNPHIFSGHPTVASGQSGFLYPPRYLLHELFSPAVARTWLQILHLFGAGLAMHWFFQTKGLSQRPCFLGGFTWMGNGYILSWLEFEHVAIASVYLPLLLVSLEKALGGARLWWLLMPLLGALSLHSGHLQINLYTGLIVTAYGLARIYQTQEIKNLAYFSGVALLTAGLAAPTVLPFLELLGDSQRPPLSLSANAAGLPTLLLSLLSPDVWGDPTSGFLLNQSEANLIYPEFACFVGAIPVALALLARGTEARVLQLLLVGSLLLASVSFGLTLPLLDRFIPGRILHLTVFCLAYLAALGAAQLERSEVSRRHGRWLAAGLALLWCVVLGSLSYLAHQPAALLEWWRAHPQRVKLPPMGVDETQFLEAFQNTYLWNPQLLLPLVAALALAAAPRRLGLLAGLTALQMALFGASFNTSVEPSSLFTSTPEIEALRGGGRTVTIGGANYNTLLPYGVSLVNGYESLVPGRYYTTLSQVEPGRPLPMRSLAIRRLEQPLLDALAVRHALVPPTHEVEAEGWKLVYQGIGGRVYRNEEAVPRAHLVGAVYPLQSLVQLTDFDPGREAFVSVAPPPGLAPGEGEVTWVRDEANTLELIVETDSTQLLVLTDSFYPGWEARVGGEKANLFPVNLASRGLYLKPGVHRVEFLFQPRPFWWGVGLAVLSLLALLAGLLWELSRRAGGEGRKDPS